MTRTLISLLSVFILMLSQPVVAEQQYSIYLDADFDSAKASSISIMQGINTALAEVNYKIQGYRFDIIAKNHSRNPLISRDNLTSYIKDDNALVVFSGIHSPPLISNKSYINNNKILLLDPWAAATSLTRTNSSQNWIFRLSIDDNKAGSFIVKSLLKNGFKNPYLILEDTVWGHQNYDQINKELNVNGIKPQDVSWFNWGISAREARPIVNKVVNSDCDMVLFIGNAVEAKTFTKVVVEEAKRFAHPVYSHWGVTGGDFYEFASQIEGHDLDLTFIQTKFAFTNPELSPFAKKVLSNAIRYNKDIEARKDIKAPTGFIHAYDLTRLLIAAINQVGLTGDKDKDKQAIHRALENLNHPVQGLIKTYHKPFSPYTKATPDAHEALTIEDYALGRYGAHGEIYLITD